MTPAEEMELLERWCPRLRYDSQTVFYAISASAMTDAPGNRVVRGKRTLASASGVPFLSLDWLREYEERGSTEKSSAKERIRQDTDRLGDARQFQGHPRYADRVHGRAIERDDAVRYLQYWLWFYSTPAAVASSFDQPVWRLLQIEFVAGKPVRLVVRNTAARLRGDGSAVAMSRPYDGTERPEVFVSPLTHNLFFEAGEVAPGFGWDRADGAGRNVIPTVELFDGWQRWPGRWGAGDGGIASPAFDAAWKRPDRADRSSVTVTRRVLRFLYGPRAPRGSRRSFRSPRSRRASYREA